MALPAGAPAPVAHTCTRLPGSQCSQDSAGTRCVAARPSAGRREGGKGDPAPSTPGRVWTQGREHDVKGCTAGRPAQRAVERACAAQGCAVPAADARARVVACTHAQLASAAPWANGRVDAAGLAQGRTQLVDVVVALVEQHRLGTGGVEQGEVAGAHVKAAVDRGVGRPGRAGPAQVEVPGREDLGCAPRLRGCCLQRRRRLSTAAGTKSKQARGPVQWPREGWAQSAQGPWCPLPGGQHRPANWCQPSLPRRP